MKTKISVCPYYASLGVPASAEGEMKFTLPDPIDLSAEDKPKMDFITRYTLLSIHIYDTYIDPKITLNNLTGFLRM